MDFFDEPRLIKETGVEGKVAAIIEPLIKQLGFRLIRIIFLNRVTLQIMAESLFGILTIRDCERISRAISPVLDVANLIKAHYCLEVSSPGIDRPLVRKSDFLNGSGHLAKIHTSVMLHGRRKFCGKIADSNDESFLLDDGLNQEVRISYSDLCGAHLILTDSLIRDVFCKEKRMRSAPG
ncbi:MAG: ribosome maturation factor RimP [Candidatus Tokpelaia sp. JSC161]|nr:MAG: ribosome maturation factor RimP [Candidatus Tokpelaia sp. JSC161]